MIQEKKLILIEIAKMNECSIKTVKDDLFDLNTQWNHLLELNYKNGLLFSNNTSYYDFMLLKKHLYKQEIKIQIIIQMFLFPNLEMIDYAQMLDYSESHIRRQIKPTNEYLKFHKSKIEYNSKTFKYNLITHNQLHHTFFISQLMKESFYCALLPPFTDKQEQDYTRQVNTIPQFFKERSNEEFRLFLKVMLYNSKVEDLKYNLNQINHTYLKFQAIKPSLSQDLKSYLKQNNLNPQTQDQKLILDIMLLISIKATLFPIKVDTTWNRYDFYYHSLTTKNKQTFNLYKQFMKKITKKHKIQYEPYISELAFDLFTMVHSLEDTTPYTIGIHSDISYSHAMSLVYSYKKHLSLETIEIYQKEKRYDLILSTQTFQDEINENKIIKISDKISLTEIKKIHPLIHYH